MHVCADNTTALIGLQSQVFEGMLKSLVRTALLAMYTQVSMYVTP